jgi:hypothetical protein
VEAVLAWRDFMVSDYSYSDKGAAHWLAHNNIDLLRGTGGLTDPGLSRSTAYATPPITWCSRTEPIRSRHRYPA